MFDCPCDGLILTLSKAGMAAGNVGIEEHGAEAKTAGEEEADKGGSGQVCCSLYGEVCTVTIVLCAMLITWLCNTGITFRTVLDAVNTHSYHHTGAEDAWSVLC